MLPSGSLEWQYTACIEMSLVTNQQWIIMCKTYGSKLENEQKNQINSKQHLYFSAYDFINKLNDAQNGKTGKAQGCLKLLVEFPESHFIRPPFFIHDIQNAAYETSVAQKEPYQ